MIGDGICVTLYSSSLLPPFFPQSGLSNCSHPSNILVQNSRVWVSCLGQGLVVYDLSLTSHLHRALEASIANAKYKAYITNVIKPISLKVLDAVQTTGFLGWRSDRNTKLYVLYIENVLATVQELGINTDIDSMPVSQQHLLKSSYCRIN